MFAIPASQRQTDHERYLAAKAKIAQEDEARERVINAQRSAIGASTAGIKAKCAQEWPVDFRMQAYCIEQQRGAVKALLARSMEDTDFARYGRRAPVNGRTIFRCAIIAKKSN